MLRTPKDKPEKFKAIKKEYYFYNRFITLIKIKNTEIKNTKLKIK